MKKLLLTAVLIGWFFGLRIPYPGSPTMSISVVVGAFESKAACEEDMQYAKMFFSQFFAGPFIEAGCKEKVEA